MIKQAHTQINDLLKQLEGALEGATIEEVVQIGDFLWRFVNKANSVMGPIKLALREEACEQITTGSFQINGHGGTACTVTIPKPSLRIKKGADLVALKALLNEKFEEIFEKETKYKPKPNIEETCLSLPEDLRDSVLGVLDSHENTPRVSFKS